MASLLSAQLLINQSELDEIFHIIHSAKDPEVKIVGSLFGLWRNSMVQPVVHLVTGPGNKAKISKSSFSPDYNYHHSIKECLNEDHGLLQIGLWCSGNANRYPILDRRSSYFDLRTSLIPQKGRYVVLMFVGKTRGTGEIEYQIIDRVQGSSRAAILTARDVLPGPSSFRSLEQVVQIIDKGAMFPSHLHGQAGEYRSVRWPSTTKSPSTTEPLSTTKSPSTAETDQWYESDGGASLLRSLLNNFNTHNVNVKMSRKIHSMDLILTINDSVCLHLPADFPTGEMSFTWVDDQSRFTRNPNDICRIIVDRTLNIISHETALRLSRTTRV